jgi:ATP-dependent Clp protease protease subunit
MDLEELFSEVEKFGFDPITYQYFHQLLEKRTIVLNDYVCDETVEKVYLPLREFEMDASTEPVTLILNSAGGSVTNGFYLAQYISQYSKPLNIIVPGMAASMAGIILAGGGKNENVIRYGFPASYVLLHDGYVALEASEARTADDIMEFNKGVDADIREFIITNTSITPEVYDAHARKQWFIKGQELKELNLIDHIYGVDDK